MSFKKTLSASVCWLVASLLSAGASSVIVVNSTGWGDANRVNGLADNGLVWGFVINTVGATMGPDVGGILQTNLVNFTVPALVGSTTPSTPALIQGTSYAFVRGTADSTNGPPPTFSAGNFFSVNLNYSAGVSAGDAVGLLWFDAGASTIGNNANFGFQDLSAILPADGSDVASGFSGTPTTMQFQTVPEPGLLGLTGLAALGLLRRRRP